MPPQAICLGPAPDWPCCREPPTASPPPPPPALGSAPAAPPPRPRPTPLPTFTPGAPFRLSQRLLVCDDPAPLPRLQVIVLDSAGDGGPNLLVRVIWDAGQDQFFTGLK